MRPSERQVGEMIGGLIINNMVERGARVHRYRKKMDGEA